jgi:hypothetical protein
MTFVVDTRKHAGPGLRHRSRRDQTPRHADDDDADDDDDEVPESVGDVAAEAEAAIAGARKAGDDLAMLNGDAPLLTFPVALPRRGSLAGLALIILPSFKSSCSFVSCRALSSSFTNSQKERANESNSLPTGLRKRAASPEQTDCAMPV